MFIQTHHFNMHLLCNYWDVHALDLGQFFAFNHLKEVLACFDKHFRTKIRIPRITSVNGLVAIMIWQRTNRKTNSSHSTICHAWEVTLPSYFIPFYPQDQIIYSLSWNWLFCKKKIEQQDKWQLTFCQLVVKGRKNWYNITYQ